MPARSEATEESDIDILALTSLVKPNLIGVRIEAGLKMWGIDLDVQDDAAEAEEDEALLRMAQARLASTVISDAIPAEQVCESLGIKLDDGE